MIKDIVVNLPLQAEHDRLTRYAASMAGFFNAQLTGIAFSYEPVVASVALAASGAGFIEEQGTTAKKNAQDAIERLKFEIRREGIPWTGHQITASVADAPARFAEIARGFDLSVVQQNRSDVSAVDDLVAEAALFETGRPVIVVPYIQTALFKTDRIAIFWDGSAPATRAINDALPFLNRARKVELVSIAGERELRHEMAGAKMAEHLARHGVAAAVKRVQAGSDTAAAMLNYVADTSPDLIVMGGYGHSRIQEFILGGATRGVMRSMTVPAFMSH